jgi:hypothetical protein
VWVPGHARGRSLPPTGILRAPCLARHPVRTATAAAALRSAGHPVPAPTVLDAIRALLRTTAFTQLSPLLVLLCSSARCSSVCEGVASRCVRTLRNAWEVAEVGAVCCSVASIIVHVPFIMMWVRRRDDGGINGCLTPPSPCLSPPLLSRTLPFIILQFSLSAPGYPGT